MTKRKRKSPTKSTISRKTSVKRRQNNQRASLIFPLFLLVLVSGALSFFYVDHLVVSRLSSRKLAQAPVIFSQALRVVPDNTFSLDTLLNQLQARQYRRVSSTPQYPGEYYLSQKELRLITREFVGANGRTETSSEILIDLNTGQFHNISNPHTSNVFFLEPQVVTYLGSADTRRSNYKTLDSIPEKLLDAVLATEDQRFYHHSGIDLIGIGRAAAINLLSLQIKQGGSTITQQLAKNMLFSPKRTIIRKVLEALAAISLEMRLSKEQILELYLNEVYLGQTGAVAIHGVAEAATHFFGKEIEAISLADCALLAGLIRAPSYYSPRRHPQRAINRRNTVLNSMKEQGAISSQELKLAKLAKLSIIPLPSTPQTAAHFVSALRNKLEESFNVSAAMTSGLAIYTGLDLNLQQCAANAVAIQLDKLEKTYPALKRKPALEASLVAIEPHSGLVKAWIGGRNFSNNQFDHVFQAKRQIGSTIKPFIYLTALDSNSYSDSPHFTAISILPDQPTEVRLVTGQTWRPENYDHRYRGQVTLRYALEQSLNLPTVYLSQQIGITNFARTVQDFGLAKAVLEVPALALGALESTLLQSTTAYAALANNGIYVAPRLFISAQEPDKTVLLTSRISERRVASEPAAYVTTNILQGVVERGTGRIVRQSGWNGLAAGKTGTTNETRDAWFMGYTPTLAVGVWTGYDDNKKLGLTGASAAAPIWAAFMQCAKGYQTEFDFIMPPGAILARLDAKSGQLAGPNCPAENIVEEVFIRGTEPNTICSLHSGDSNRFRNADLPFEPYQEKPSPHRRQNSFWDYLMGQE